MWEERILLRRGELSGWKTVSTDKMERSPKTQSLNQDQVNIVTPSRFDALRNTDEKGEEVDTESVEEDMEEEEDIYQSRVEENIESTKKERARQMLPRLGLPSRSESWVKASRSERWSTNHKSKVNRKVAKGEKEVADSLSLGRGCLSLSRRADSLSKIWAVVIDPYQAQTVRSINYPSGPFANDLGE
ncbi:hypothetical protein YC2023_019267 [Brassica napus]